MSPDLIAQVQALPCWRGAVTPQPLSGGITNVNLLVEDQGQRYVVRLGGDIPEHLVMRFNELTVSRAAYAAGLSPEVVYSEAGVLVLRYIAGKVYSEADVQDDANLERIIGLIKRFHREVPQHLRGATLAFWVFQVLRDYGRTLEEGHSQHRGILADLLRIADRLEAAVGDIQLVFGHNDLLAANLIDDGQRLWIIDFDYAGFNSPLFDLGNLGSNNQLSETQERAMLTQYFGTAPDDQRWRAYNAMKCASLLRETLWSMVSEIHSRLDFDYATYTAENLARFQRCYYPLAEELDL